MQSSVEGKQDTYRSDADLSAAAESISPARESDELSAPPANVNPTPRSGGLTTLSIADGLYLFVIVAAGIMRFTGLAAAPLSSLEAEEALAIWRYLQPGASSLALGSPAYFSLTSLLMPFLGVSDLTARLVPALFGMGLIVLPWFLRERLGRTAVLVAATLFAVSPLFAIVSRTAGGESIALFAILLAAVAVLRLNNGDGDKWLYVLAAACGIGLASAPLFFSGLTTLVVARWAQIKISPEKHPAYWPERAVFLNALILGAVTLIALSTRFFTFAGGLGASTQLLGDWVTQFSLQGNLEELLAPLYALARYEIILLPLGIFAIAWAIWRNHPLGTLFTYWLLGGLIVILLQRGVMSNVLLVPLAGYLLLGVATDSFLRRGVTQTTWAVVTVLVLVGSVALVNAIRILRVSGTESQISNIWITLLAVGAAALVIYFLWVTYESAVLKGAWVALLLLLISFQWGTAWYLTHTAANDPRELWVEQAADDEIPVLVRSLREISRRATNSDYDISLLSAVDNPVLRWYLRDYWQATIGSSLPPDAQHDVIITRADIAEPIFGSDYLGGDFGILRTGSIPAAPSATPFQDTLRTLLFHETQSSLTEERIIIWVRADLAQSQ